jgi:hypothetical protein
MSTLFTNNYDSPATAIPVASSIIPTMTSGNVPGTIRHDQLCPISGPTRMYLSGTSSLGALTGLDTNGRAGVANTMWFSDIFVPYPCTILGAAHLNGTTVGTTKAIASLYNAAGTLVANSSVTGGGAVTVGASVFQERLFTTAYVAKPGRYWIGYMPDSTTDTVRTIVAATYVHVNTGTVAGGAATATASLTPTTTFTANLGIFSYLYTA